MLSVSINFLIYRQLTIIKLKLIKNKIECCFFQLWSSTSGKVFSDNKIEVNPGN